ncbi:MAG: hypothetical protein ABJB61_03605 [bacterium]
MLQRAAVVWIALLAVIFAGGCGSKPALVSTPAKSLPPCAKAGPAVGLPPDFPSNFPLPPGAVITSSQRYERGAIVVGGFIPLELKDAVAFFKGKLPAAGYQLLEGDAEMDEAESTFSGQGFRGKWKVNGLLNCPGVVALTIALSKP